MKEIEISFYSYIGDTVHIKKSVSEEGYALLKEISAKIPSFDISIVKEKSSKK
jgi:hypothetical protein